MSWTADRYHDFSYGHRVYQHESKCAHLHGHNGRVHFTIGPEVGLDSVGRVMDFSVIKSLLCMWLEDNWDHKFLIWEKDPWAEQLAAVDPTVVIVTFNPTAENLAQHLVEVVAPQQLKETGCVLIECRFEETRKCAASFIKG
jgi:6-pyruvoyltetrahydropterin/6-carboxytetrahydropterin synthase